MLPILLKERVSNEDGNKDPTDTQNQKVAVKISWLHNEDRGFEESDTYRIYRFIPI